MLVGRSRIAGDAGVAGMHAVGSMMRPIIDEAVLQDFGVRPQDFLQLIKSLFELPSIAGSEPRLLPLTILARY